MRIPAEPLEYRGHSYAIGGDPDAITLPNIFKHYTDNVGFSTGAHLPLECMGPLCLRPKSDALNAAMSGSVSTMLVGQVHGEPSST